jgi:glucose-1-phosphate thymidylyltransferase
MIPVANRPIIEYTIEALLKNGIREIIVVVGYRKEQVTRFLNQLDVPVEVVVQDKQLGTGHALFSTQSKIHENFLLLPGDNFIDPSSIARIKEVPNAILIKEHPNPSNFGVVMLDEGLVTGIVEKPEHAASFMVSTGIYSLTPDVFPHIRANTMTEALTSMIDSGIRIRGIPADDWQDAIFAWDILKMNRRLLHTLIPAREGTISRQAHIQGPVRIGRGTTIGPNTVISGPVIIGNDCTIGPNCCIMPNTSIGSRAIIEPLSYIANTIIMDDTSIGSNSRIVDTVIGERCLLADHTSTWTSMGLLEIEGIPTRAQFGAILGDTVRSGPFTMYKNSVIGNSVTIEGQTNLTSKYIQDDAVVI